MLQVLAGHDPLDPASARVAVPDYAAGLCADLKGMRIGVLRQFYEADSPADADVVQALDDAIMVLKDLGATIVEMPRLSPMQDYLAAAFVMTRSEAYAIHEQALQSQPGLFGSQARQRILMGGMFTAADYVQAMRRRQELVTEFAAAMAGVDLVVLPTVPTAAPSMGAIGAHTLMEKPLYTTPFNLTGSPAMSVCSGFNSEHMPLSLQFVGRPFDETSVLRAGDAYERATQWRHAVPQPESVAA